MRRLFPFVVLFAATAGVWLAGGLDPVERLMLDARFRLLTRPAGDDVVIVAIDPPSLGKLDVWPWPRGYHATILENLFDAGARAVAFDVDFSSRSLPEEDAELEAALASQAGRVVLPVFRQHVSDATGLRLHTTAPLERFREHAVMGAINIRPDADGLVRRYTTGEEVDGRWIPSFAAALAGDDGGVPRTFVIDFGVLPDSFPRLSYVDVLTGTFDPGEVAGRAVIVGATAVELGDQVAVPLAKALPGPVLQALACESQLRGRALCAVPAWLTLAGALVLALGLGPWLSRRGWRAGAALAAVACAAAFAVSLGAQWASPWLVEIVPWVTVVTGSYGVGLVRRIDQQTVQIVLHRLRLRRTRDLMRLVVENSFDAIVTVARDGTVESANRAAAVLFGRPPEDLRGRPIEDLIALPDDDGHEGDLGSRSGSGPWEVVALRPGGPVAAEMTASTVRDGDAVRRVAFLRDITERKAQRRALEHQASHDVLTDLPNRLLLNRRMEAALQGSRQWRRPVSFLLLDLDHFREINDTLGHHAGDVLLSQVAVRLRSPLRRDDTIARLGGDEFAVLLPDAGLDEARETARRLTDCLDQPFLVEGLPLRVGTTIGIAVFPEHGGDPETLIQRADVAMYAAKRDRSGVTVYHRALDHHGKRHLALTGELRGAIERGGLELHYQPKVAAGTGAVVGVEALVRWTHAEHGSIPPDEFVGIAERSGLIRPLTSWVLETALEQCAAWRSQGMDLQMSVNLSARNLLDDGLPATVRHMLEANGVPAEKLCLEITESVIMEDPRRALAVLTDIAASGVGISIDDFGTGYSSLGYLRKLPAGEIKIDRSFVIDMDRNADDATIVRSTIELAHNLGLRVVAEGIERPEVWTALRDLGCDLGQGFLFSRPLQAGELARWYRGTGTHRAAVG